MVHLHPNLLIERQGLSLLYPHHALRKDFQQLPADLMAAVNHKLNLWQQDAHYFSDLSSEQQQQLNKLFVLYGQKLYESVIPHQLQVVIDQFKEIQISENDKNVYHWQLLHDGHRFCQDYLSIQKVYPYQLASSKLDLVEDTYSLSFIQGVGYKTSFTEQFNNICHISNNSWLLMAKNLDKYQISYFGLLNRHSLQEMFANSKANLLVISAYCDQKGLIEYNPNRDSFDHIAFNNLANYLKNAVYKGLQGVIFQFWDWRSNKPFSDNRLWLSNSGVDFAIEWQGVIEESLFSSYVDSLVGQLIIGKNISQAHLKSMAKLSANSNYPEVQFKTMLHLPKPANQKLKISFKHRQESTLVFNDPVALMRNRVSAGSYASDWALRLLTALKIPTNPILLYNFDYQPLIEQIYQFILLKWQVAKFNVKEFAVPYDYSILSLFGKLSQPYNKQLLNLWDSFVINQSSFKGNSNNILIITNGLPRSDFFYDWLQQQVMNGWQILIVDDQPTKDIDCLTLDPQASVHDKKMGHTSSLANDSLLVDPLWLKKHLALMFSGFVVNDLDQSTTSYDYLQKLLSKEQKFLLALLLICKTTVIKDVLVRQLGNKKTSLSADLRYLQKLKLIHYSFDQQLLWIDANVAEYLIAAKFFTQQYQLEVANQITINWFIDYRHKIDIQFLAGYNLSHFLAFKGDYRQAILFLLQFGDQLKGSLYFEAERLFIIGLSCLQWLQHLDEDLFPQWISIIWLQFIAPYLRQLPVKLSKEYLSMVVDQFSKQNNWAGYALAISDLANVSYDKDKKAIFKSLAEESLSISKKISEHLCFNIYISLLANLAIQDDLKLFEEFADKYPLTTKIKPKSQLAKVEVILLDAWYLMQTEYRAEELIAITEKILKADFSLFVKMEEIVLLKLAASLKKHGFAQLPLIWKRHLDLSYYYNSKHYIKELNENLYTYYHKKEDWQNSIHYIVNLLDIAKQEKDVEAITSYSDKIAMMYYKLGNTKLNTSYYALAKNPNYIFDD